MRQYSCNIRIQAPRKRPFFSDDAKQYLKERLEISNLDKISGQNPFALPLTPFVQTFVLFTSAVAQHALESGSFPAFDNVRIISSEKVPKHPGEIIVTLASPTAAHLGNKFILDAYNLSFMIVSEFTKPKFKRDKLDELTNLHLDNFVRMTRLQTKGGYSSRFMLREAFNRRIPLTHLGSGHYQYGFGCNAKIFNKSATPNDSMIGAILTNDKYACIQRMKMAGIPVPLSNVAFNAQHANDIAKEIGFPVVVKPADRDRGEGVTVDVREMNDVARAFENAKVYSNKILVEKHVAGICHRLIIFKETMIYAYSRHPASVIGDGVSTIKKLLEKERNNELRKAKHLRKKVYALDEEAIFQLKIQYCEPETIPEKNQIIYLRPYEVQGDGYNELNPDGTKIHSANVDLARRAARIFGLESAGIDMISTDISLPWYDTGAVINEVNFRPQVDSESKAYLERLFQDGQSEIPIECFIGDEGAITKAVERLKELKQKSICVFLTSHNITLDNKGEIIRLSDVNGVFRRAEILLQDTRVEYLIVVLQTDELLATGLPFWESPKVTQVNSNIMDASNLGETATSGNAERLVNFLNGNLNGTKIS